MRHELICLEYENGEWKLKPGEAFQELRETRSDTPTSVTASSAQNVFAISIIGDTGNGKTFTTRELLSLDDKDLGAPFIGDAGTESPTSCNITCFKAENITVNLLASTRTNEGESRNYFANGQDGARDNRLAQDEIGRS
ncbi:unnamed protein product [Rotaria magnacalcarata]|uniref:Uncharacterized protein n=1 Tax=Rotaria magnacalcarata TaxID=392030 RepID=A0A820DU74_9BILA|nr:unnamed protein product [Rotaria magnacalcarata]